MRSKEKQTRANSKPVVLLPTPSCFLLSAFLSAILALDWGEHSNTPGGLLRGAMKLFFNSLNKINLNLIFTESFMETIASLIGEFGRG
jgi:hypothetical protein